MDYLYSQLPEIVYDPAALKGKSTNGTAEVTVDNEKRTIDINVLRTPGTLTIHDTNTNQIYQYDGSQNAEITLPNFKDILDIVYKTATFESIANGIPTADSKPGDGYLEITFSDKTIYAPLTVSFDENSNIGSGSGVQWVTSINTYQYPSLLPDNASVGNIYIVNFPDDPTFYLYEKAGEGNNYTFKKTLKDGDVIVALDTGLLTILKDNKLTTLTDGLNNKQDKLEFVGVYDKDSNKVVTKSALESTIESHNKDENAHTEIRNKISEVEAKIKSNVINVTKLFPIIQGEENLPSSNYGRNENGYRHVVSILDENGKQNLYIYGFTYDSSTGGTWHRSYKVGEDNLYIDFDTQRLYRYTMGEPYFEPVAATVNLEDAFADLKNTVDNDIKTDITKLESTIKALENNKQDNLVFDEAADYNPSTNKVATVGTVTGKLDEFEKQYGISGISGTLKDHEGRITNVETNIGTLTGKQEELSGKISANTGNIATLNTTLSGLKEDVDYLNKNAVIQSINYKGDFTDQFNQIYYEYIVKVGNEDEGGNEIQLLIEKPKNGEKGESGVGITNLNINQDTGELQVSFSDGKVEKIGKITGDDGITPKLNATVTLGDSNIVPTVTKSGTNEDVIFNFTLPRGEKGEIGESLDFNWDNTQLGVKKASENKFNYRDLKGPEGKIGKMPFSILLSYESDEVRVSEEDNSSKTLYCFKVKNVLDLSHYPDKNENGEELTEEEKYSRLIGTIGIIVEYNKSSNVSLNEHINLGTFVKIEGYLTNNVTKECYLYVTKPSQNQPSNILGCIRGAQGERGEGFKISCSYTSYNEMYQNKSNIVEGACVMISPPSNNSSQEVIGKGNCYVYQNGEFTYIGNFSGIQGPPGVAPKISADGYWIQTNENGIEEKTQVKAKGTDGAAGKDGNNVVSARIDNQGQLQLQLQNPTTNTQWWKIVEGGSIVGNSTKWYVDDNAFINDQLNDGDMLLMRKTQQVYQYDKSTKEWKNQGVNLKGEKGEKGEQGEQGIQGIQGPQGESGIPVKWYVKNYSPYADNVNIQDYSSGDIWFVLPQNASGTVIDNNVDITGNVYVLTRNENGNVEWKLSGVLKGARGETGTNGLSATFNNVIINSIDFDQNATASVADVGQNKYDLTFSIPVGAPAIINQVKCNTTTPTKENSTTNIYNASVEHIKSSTSDSTDPSYNNYDFTFGIPRGVGIANVYLSDAEGNVTTESETDQNSNITPQYLTIQYDDQGKFKETIKIPTLKGDSITNVTTGNIIVNETNGTTTTPITFEYSNDESTKINITAINGTTINSIKAQSGSSNVNEDGHTITPVTLTFTGKSGGETFTTNADFNVEAKKYVLIDDDVKTIKAAVLGELTCTTWTIVTNNNVEATINVHTKNGDKKNYQ